MERLPVASFELNYTARLIVMSCCTGLHASRDMRLQKLVKVKDALRENMSNRSQSES